MAKKRTRANGDGTIFYNESKKLYTARILIGRNPDTGKPVMKEFSSRDRNTAKEKMRVYLEENPEYNPRADKTALDIYIRKFLYVLKKPIVSAKTLQRYESIYNTHISETETSKNICPFLYQSMKTVQSTQIREWYGELNESDSTIKLIHIIINGAFKLAFEDRVITYNPAQVIKMKKEEVSEEDVTAVLTPKEQKKLIEALDLNNPVHRLLYFVLGTGLRLGEALPLRWNDFKTIKGQRHVVIKRSLSRVKNEDDTYEDVEGDPKTAAVIKETSQLLKLNNGDVVRQSTWNGEKWYDNGKEYRPLYSYNYETNDSVIAGIEIK